MLEEWMEYTIGFFPYANDANPFGFSLPIESPARPEKGIQSKAMYYGVPFINSARDEPIRTCQSANIMRFRANNLRYAKFAQ